MELADLKKELDVLQKKSIKYDNMQSRYIELAAKLKKAAELISEVAGEIDPYISVNSTQSKRENWSEIIAEIYDKMQHGTEFTTEMVRSIYNLSHNKANYLMSFRIRNMPNVATRKLPDSRTIAYYCEKEFK